MKGRQDLGRAPIPRLVLGLAVPAMIAQFVNVLYSLIDRVYIGNIPEIGDLALAGVGVCGPIVTLLSSFGTLVGLGGSILMAIRMGEGDNEAARRVLANCFMLLTGLSAVLTVGFLLCRRPLLLCFGASSATFVYADTYMTIYTAGTFFALMAVGLNYFITCQGFSTVGMAAVLIGAVANIVLDPVFIFVLDMGGGRCGGGHGAGPVFKLLLYRVVLVPQAAHPHRVLPPGRTPYAAGGDHWFSAVSDHGHRQPDPDCHERGAAAVRRPGAG